MFYVSLFVSMNNMEAYATISQLLVTFSCSACGMSIPVKYWDAFPYMRLDGGVQNATSFQIVDSARAAANIGREILDTVDKLGLWFLPCRKRIL